MNSASAFQIYAPLKTKSFLTSHRPSHTCKHEKVINPRVSRLRMSGINLDNIDEDEKPNEDVIPYIRPLKVDSSEWIDLIMKPKKTWKKRTDINTIMIIGAGVRLEIP